MKVNDWWGWAETNRMLVHKWLPKLCNLVGSQPLAPVTDEFIGQLGSIPIKTKNPLELKDVLYNKFKIEIPVMESPNTESVYLRFSLNAFNTEQDLEHLEKAIISLMERGLIEKYAN
jgi:isopenicillin-N epimerase